MAYPLSVRLGQKQSKLSMVSISSRSWKCRRIKPSRCSENNGLQFFCSSCSGCCAFAMEDLEEEEIRHPYHIRGSYWYKRSDATAAATTTTTTTANTVKGHLSCGQLFPVPVLRICCHHCPWPPFHHAPFGQRAIPTSHGQVSPCACHPGHAS